MKKRSLKVLFLAASWSLSPFFLLAILLVVDAVNPLSVMFLHSFSIENQTDKEIIVSPIGAVGSEGVRHPLPISSSKRFHVISVKNGNFPIPAKTAREFTYDWDDIQFSEILTRRKNGDWKVMKTGLHPTRRQYRMPEKTLFEISDLDELPNANDIHLEAISGKSPGLAIMYVLAALGLVSPVLIRMGFRMKT